MIIGVALIFLCIPAMSLGYGYWHVNKPKPFCSEPKAGELRMPKCPNIKSFWHNFFGVNPCPVCIDEPDK